MVLRRVCVACIGAMALNNVVYAAFLWDLPRGPGLFGLGLGQCIATVLLGFAHILDYRARRLRVIVQDSSGRCCATLAAVPLGWPAGRMVAVIQTHENLTNDATEH